MLFCYADALFNFNDWSFRMRRLLAFAAILASASAFAGTDFTIRAPNQPDFRKVSEDIAAALNYKALGPAEATGLTGAGVGAFVVYTPVQNKDAWKRLTLTNVDAVGMAGIAVHKGLPLNLDVGAFYSKVPGTNVNVYGAELRYAILAGTPVTPALALRASATRTSGSDDFKFSTQGIDAEISKGFTLLTPYAGVGYLESTSDPNPKLLLRKEKISDSRYFAGLRVALGLFEMTPEIERIGDNTSYNLRLGFSL